MKKYLVSVNKEVCGDFEIEAETPQEAEKKALAHGHAHMVSDEWCEGHMGSFTATAIEELPE